MKRIDSLLGMRRLDRYIIKKFLGTYIFMIALIISIAVVFDINEKIDKFMTNNASLHDIIFHYYLNFIPFYTNLFSPLFVFLAVIFFTSKMANNSEITAILSNGIGFQRLMKPYMISALVIAVFAFVFGSYVIPPANATRIEFEQTYVDPRKKKTGDRDIQFKVGPGTIVYFGNFDMPSKTGYNFSMDYFDSLQLMSPHSPLRPLRFCFSLDHQRLPDPRLRRIERNNHTGLFPRYHPADRTERLHHRKQ